MTLPANWATGQTFTAAAENAVEAAVNALQALMPVGAVVGTTDSQNLTGKTLTSPTIITPTINGYTEGVQALGVVSTTKTIPALSNGTVVTATLTASTTCVFTQPTMTAGQSYTLYLKQPAATGNGAATFTGVKWPAVGAPVITVTAGLMDILSFVSDGTDIFGSYVQGYTY